MGGWKGAQRGALPFRCRSALAMGYRALTNRKGGMREKQSCTLLLVRLYETTRGMRGGMQGLAPLLKSHSDPFIDTAAHVARKRHPAACNETG